MKITNENIISQGIKKGKIRTDILKINQTQMRLAEISLLTTRLLDLYVGENNMGEITLSRSRKISNTGKSSNRFTEVDSVSQKRQASLIKSGYWEKQ